MSPNMSRGYSLLEVVLSTFLLTGMALASYSTFLQGSGAVRFQEKRLDACSLASQICEQLHTQPTADVANLSNVPFPPPDDRYLYSVEVEKPDLTEFRRYLEGVKSGQFDYDYYLAGISRSLAAEDLDRQVAILTDHLQKIRVTVTGPFDTSGRKTLDTATIALSMLLAGNDANTGSGAQAKSAGQP